MTIAKRATNGEVDQTTKKQTTQFKTTENGDIKQHFGPGIFEQEFRDTLKQSISDSQPYRWGTIKNLIDDTLLRNVRKEVEREIHFTKKETDIYKVHQSGDLANLSGLDWDDLSRLPSLFKLREAMYSQEFRDMISEVTQCGKLSGVKTDMSINTYTKGCHLLTHDDVIGSRRVSFILYLPEPDKTWKEHYGGALRLFPAIVPNVPKADPTVELVPQFNQIAFFTVQPGLSFHDVQEVRVDKHRLSIQGWYHIPQSGEDGFIEGEQEKYEGRSTLQQLESKELEVFDFPKEVRIPFSQHEVKNYEVDELKFTEFDLKYLSKYMNPLLLRQQEIQRLQKIFIDESLVDIQDILNEEYSEELKKQIRTTELDEIMPKHQDQIEFPWKLSLPPHKWRYMYLDGKQEEVLTESGVEMSNQGPQNSPNFELLAKTTKHETSLKLIELASFLKSVSFKKWLSLITDLIPISDQILVRRFRPGHDFKLATSINNEDSDLDALLEGTLCLTPSKGWDSGEVGGYELGLVTGDPEDDDDPAIYKQSKDEDDSVLVNNQASWNNFSLMLRDPSVLKFIKYVSYNAKGSRWDISCQWNVKTRGDDNEDEEEEDDKRS